MLAIEGKEGEGARAELIRACQQVIEMVCHFGEHGFDATICTPDDLLAAAEDCRDQLVEQIINPIDVAPGARPAPSPTEEHGTDHVTAEGLVSKTTGLGFMQLTCWTAGEEGFWQTKMPCAVGTAMGLRIIQASIEAERDAGMVAYLRDCAFDDPQVSAMLLGMREHREQFDPELGSARPIVAEEKPWEGENGG